MILLHQKTTCRKFCLFVMMTKIITFIKVYQAKNNLKINFMKKLFLSFVMMMTAASIFAQIKMAACCMPVAATEQFAKFASNKKFLMSHPAPLPFHYYSAN